MSGVVCAAGAAVPADLLTSSPDDWTRAFEANFLTALVTCQAAAPHLGAGGAIVLVGSLAGVRGSRISMPYGVAKAGVGLLARALAVQMAARGVRVNLVIPGVIETPMLRGTAATLGPTPAESSDRGFVATLLERVPLGRAGTTGEVASTIAFLLSDDAGYVTGAQIAIDGAHLARGGFD